jgi:hypothetical protein
MNRHIGSASVTRRSFRHSWFVRYNQGFILVVASIFITSTMIDPPFGVTFVPTKGVFFYYLFDSVNYCLFDSVNYCLFDSVNYYYLVCDILFFFDRYFVVGNRSLVFHSILRHSGSGVFPERRGQVDQTACLWRAGG